MPTNYNELYTGNSLTYLDITDFHVVEAKAKILSLEQCLEYLCIDIEDIPALELKLLKRCHRRGRLLAINTAADSLFSNMKDPRSGVTASMEYLRAFSDTFSVEATASGNAGFSFNVTLNDEEDDNKTLKSVK